MLKGSYVSQSIVEYKQAYENAGIEPPAYRITCKEHKELTEYCKPLMAKDWKPSMISEYYGVTIEVVMIVDAYI